MKRKQQTLHKMVKLDFFHKIYDFGQTTEIRKQIPNDNIITLSQPNGWLREDFEMDEK